MTAGDGGADALAVDLPTGVRVACIAATDQQVFIADADAGCVHRFDASAGTWTRIESQAPAANAIAVAPDGRRLLIATKTHQIWQLDLRSGAAKPIAGTGQRGLEDGVAAAAEFASPAAMCVSTDGRRLYVVDRDSSAVREIDLGTHYTATIAGRGVGEHGRVDGDFQAARLDRPEGVAAVMTAQGERLVIADTGNRLIRVVDPKARTVETWADLAANGSHGPSDIAAIAAESVMAAMVACGDRVASVTGDGRIREVQDEEQGVTMIDARAGEPLDLAIGLAGLAMAERSMLRLRVSSLPNGSPARMLAQRIVSGPICREVRIQIPASSVHDGARWVVECESLCEETVEVVAASHSRWLVAVRTDNPAAPRVAMLDRSALG